MARRVLANHRRGERRRRTRHTELTAEIEHLYAAPSDHGEQDGVSEAMDLLADGDRELLALALWEGLDPGEIATVLDEDLAGRASTAGADALLAEIVVLEHVPARRRLMPSARRSLLGLAAAAVLAGGIVVGPSLFKASEQVYASQAVTIDRVGDEYAFYFTDGNPDPAELRKAFHKVGLDNLTVTLSPVSPHMPPGSVFGFEKTDPDAQAVFAGGNCPERVENCLTAFRVTADISGPAEVSLSRPAKPGEKYAYPADASWPGEALAGVKLQGRSVAEAVRVVREHDLKVAYGLDWPLSGDEKGVRFEDDVPASRVDPGWSVTAAQTYNDGVIVLRVAPGPGATPPPGFCVAPVCP